MSAGVPDLADLLEDIRKEKESWSAVESFSRWHDSVHALAGRYQGLVPLSQPKQGERYAFQVDLDRCTGCKACVTGCHSLNGLDEGESWRSVGLLHEQGQGQQVTVTSSCHHCADPACSKGCPTRAYETLDNGVVRHLDDQCMGCRYCEWTCPYGAPKWNARQGIVRKCDLCHGRLAQGEAPACVQACPNGAISVQLVAKESLVKTGLVQLPSAVDPEATRPSTRYVSAEPLGDHLVAGQESFPVPEDPHTPLAFLLVATQWSVGAAAMAAIAGLAGAFAGSPALALVSLGLFVVGLGLGSSHLGQPLRAWKAFLGWRTSWFSREVMVFGGVPPILAAWAGLPWLGAAGLDLPRWWSLVPTWILPAGAALVGSLGVFCSAMIYRSTLRPAWSRNVVFARFFLTSLGGGAVLAAASGCWPLRVLGVVSIATGLAKAFLVRRDGKPADGPLAGVAKLLKGPLRPRVAAQEILFAAAIAAAVVGTILARQELFWVAVGLRFCADLVERILFFQTALPATMPGGPR